MFQANCYNVMIVSPSDVQEERKIIRDVLYQWNEQNSRFRNIVFSVLGYDINACPDSGAHPQELLNHQLLEAADIIIAVFWTKLGTPTKEYSSGSVEEISKHIASGKKAWIYFSNKEIQPQSIDPEQYSKLQEYKKGIQGNFFYQEFSSSAEFEKMLQSHIQSLANDLKATEATIQKETNNNISNLSEIEYDILKNMKNKRPLQFVKMRGMVRIGTKLERDQRRIAEIEEALNNLESKGLIKATSKERNLFELKAAGYRVCDQIKD